MNVVLRDYQSKAITDIYRFFRLGIKSLMLYAPTGAGKTVMSLKAVADSVSKGRRVLFLVHRTTLVAQTAIDLKAMFGIESGIIWGNEPQNPDAPVQIAMIQSLQNRSFPKDIGLVVLDECHTSSYYSVYRRVMNHYSDGFLLNSKCYFIGLTATPWRSKKSEGYCQFFQALVRCPPPKDLIKMGHLAFARFFGYGGLIDYTQLEKSSSGEFTEASMRKVCDAKFNTEVVERFMSLCPNRKSIAFCGCVEQAENLAEQFNAIGVNAIAITGSMGKEERKNVYQAFKEGVVQIITSVYCLCEGFNERSCSGNIIARPVGSRALFVQMTGRTLRTFEGKEDSFILDYCGNIDRLGYPTQEYPITLCPPKKANEEPPEMTKVCPKCDEILPVFAKICVCGHEFDGDQRDEKDNLGDKPYPNFGEIFDKDSKKKLAYIRSQVRQAYTQNKLYSRVNYLFWKKYKEIPPSHFFLDAVFRRGKFVSEDQRRADEEAFKIYLRKTKPLATNHWIEEQMRKEFGRGYYNTDPVKWWEVLEVPLDTPPEKMVTIARQQYRLKIAHADPGEVQILNICLDEVESYAEDPAKNFRSA